MTAIAPEQPGDRLRRKEAVTYLNRIGCTITLRQLEKMAENNNAGGGPPFIRTRHKIIRYLRIDLDAWAYSNTKRIA